MRRHLIDLRILTLIALATALLVVAALLVAAPALAQSYSDVPSSHWARAYIASVTNRSASGHYLLDDFGSQFRPERAITRELLARSIVLASGHYGEKITPVKIADVPKGYRYYSVIQMAVHYGYMALGKDGTFKPTAQVTDGTAETVMVRWLKERYSTYDWSLLAALDPSKWQPVAGWTTGARSSLPSIVASRQLELRYNHPVSGDAHEVNPAQVVDRAEIAYMFYRAYNVASGYQLYGLASYKNVTFPVLSDRQKQIARFALKYVGYPYIWAGEYPGTASPYGVQAAGGFDCSGFVFYVMKMHFGYDSITVNQRGASDMAAAANPRITRDKLKCGDLIFFGGNGPDSTVGSIYHAGLYLGNGWFIHSTSSSDGVTLQSLNLSSYYKQNFAWGRRVLTAAELVVTQPSPTAAPAAAPSAAPAVEASPSPPAAAPSSPMPSPALP